MNIFIIGIALLATMASDHVILAAPSSDPATNPAVVLPAEILDKLQLQDPHLIQTRQSNMDFIGQIDRKLYYESKNDTFDGMAITSLCATAGLQPGTFESEAEFNYLNSLRPFDTELWTAGVLKGQELLAPSTAFEWWDGSGQDGPDIVQLNYHHSPSRWLCLYFLKHVLYPGFCLSEHRKVLCQFTA